MVQFAKKLAEAQRPIWKGNYLQYKKLKKDLKIVHNATAAESFYIQQEFERSLDAEVERVVLFFLTKQGELAHTLTTLREEQHYMPTSTSAIDLMVSREEFLENIQTLANKFRSVGEELVQLLQYVELNATGIRKILKKHDKTMKGPRKIMGSYLSTRMDANASHLAQLYHDEGISAIIATIRHALIELNELNFRAGGTSNSLTPYRRLSASASSNSSSVLALGRASITEDEPILSKIQVARRRLHQSTTYAKTIAPLALIFDGDSDEDNDAMTFESIQLMNVSHISRFLNMLMTFLYMSNYYIVAPTSAQYAAHLGGAAALSGVIVGMTPLASMASAVLFSWWANRSYKSPLIFASCCLIIGNILYGAALSFDSIEMAIAGRLLNGFGGARAINRRYIADNYSREERTSASAMFVTMSAIGMATGPAMAAGIKVLLPKPFAYHNSTFWIFSDETSPGWIMAFLWVIYLILTVIYFEEPDRPAMEHMLEQARSLSVVTLQSTPRAVSPLPIKVTENTSLLPVTSPSGGTFNRLQRGSRNLSFIGPANPNTMPAFDSLWKNVPVITTLGIYIVLKTVLEGLLTGSSLMAHFYFGWNSTGSGIYLAILGLLMFPANMIVGLLYRKYNDRELLVASEIAMGLGVLVIIHYPFLGKMSDYPLWQFLCGGFIIFVSSNVLEGVNMSILSKTIPKHYAKGTFNSGLLATEAGTFGRTIGDIAITLSGLQGVKYVLNWTFVPMAVLTLIMIIFTIRAYHYFPKQ